MARGDYTVQEVEALKQAGRDSSFRTCILTMFIFLAMCIILLLITWATWKPTRDKDAYSSHSKYSGRQRTTESPVTIFEEPTTMNTDHEKRETIPITGTSRTTESHLIKLVASDTTAKITATPATNTTPGTITTTTTTEKSLNQTVVLIPSTTTEKSLTQSTTRISRTTESHFMKLVASDTTATITATPATNTTSATITTTTTTEKYLNQTVVLIPSTTTEKSLTQSTALTTESLPEHIPTTMKQPSIATTEKTSTQDKTSEQPQSTTTEKLVSWYLATNTSISTTEHPNTTPSLAHSDPESTSTSEKTTPLVQPTESTTPRTESPRPEDQTTQKHSNFMVVYIKQSSTQSTTSLTSSTVPLESSSTDEPFAVAASAGSDSETTNLPVNNLTRPATTDSSPTTVTMPVNKQSASTATNENATSYSSTATIKLTIRDRSTTLVNATTDTTDSESTTPSSVLTSSSSSGPCVHPVFLLTANNVSTNCTSASTSQTTSTIISGTDSSSDTTNFSVSTFDDSSSEFTPTVQQINITSTISTTTGGPIHTDSEETSTSDNTTATTDVTPVTLTQHSTTVSGVTTTSIPLDKSILNTTVVPEKHSHCNSSACKVVSSRMLSLMNHSADPCEDFYEFACGGLRENRNLLQHDPVDEVWARIASAVKQIDAHSPEAFQKFNNFYDQCLMFDSIVNNTSRLEEVRKVLDNVGKMYNYTGWTEGNLNLNITSLLVKLFKLNSAPLFDVQLDVDIHNTSRFLLKLIPPTHKSKFQTESSFAAQCKNRIVPQDQKNVNLKNIYFKKYLPCTRDYGGYMNLTEKALKELGMLKDLGPFHEGQYIKDLRFFIEFDILNHLTELPETGEMRHILLSKQFKSMSVEDLQTRYPLVDWKTLLSALVGDTINPQTTVQLCFIDYFFHLFDQLSLDFNADDNNRMNMHNGLLAMFAHDLYADLVETQSPCAREDYCLKVASGLMEDVSSALYLSTFTREQLNAMELELQTLFTQLKSTLKDDFSEAEWMDDPVRSYVTSKLQQVIPITDGGRVFLSDSYLNERLSEVDMNSSNSYLRNAVQLLCRYRNGMYSFYSSQPNLTDTIWSHFLLPYDTQAIAVYQLNIVVIPFGLIGSPQSTSDLPGYIFKARVGNDLARQIAHHFDFTGIDYGSNGKDKSLLSDTSRDSYKTTQDCVENLYAFEKSWTNHKHQIFTFEVNPSQSMTEHFADSSALQLSYKTFNKTARSEPLLPWLDMSYDKLYHMLVAQEFCTKGGMLDYTIQLYESEQMPPFLRVANLAQNSEEFAQAFSCGLGTKMNPQVKCDPFPKINTEDNIDSSSMEAQ